MEVKATVSLNGLEELLSELGPKLAKSHLRKALKEAAAVFEVEAKSRAPVLSGALRDSIHTVVSTNARRGSGRAAVGPSFDPSIVKSGGSLTQDPGVYGKFVEFGVDSRHIKAQPFMRPTFDGKADEVLTKFVEVLAEGLREVAK